MDLRSLPYYWHSIILDEPVMLSENTQFICPTAAEKLTESLEFTGNHHSPLSSSSCDEDDSKSCFSRKGKKAFPITVSSKNKRNVTIRYRYLIYIYMYNIFKYITILYFNIGSQNYRVGTEFHRMPFWNKMLRIVIWSVLFGNGIKLTI